MMKSLSLALLAGALSGARAEIQLVKGGDMCAGYNSDSDDFKIYYVRPRPPAPVPSGRSLVLTLCAPRRYVAASLRARASLPTP